MTEIKLGKIFYEIIADETTGKIEFWEWHIVTVRGKWAYAVVKLDCTYGKRSKKAGDFGWLRPVPPWTRKKLSRFQTDDWFNIAPSRYGMFPTKLTALKEEIKHQDPRNFDEPEAYEKAMKTMKSMLTRERNK
ncbi:hypothetical protein PP938_gp031 [Rhizobium phage AF3]|uniref:Uncharacterized protein n=1 Tax=Rhizobium phage AF3 TaxID=2763529 RepID=A0A7G7WW85_9CAUD|nr:hypothetical protein PP938_gp031 [Rhizobium phage AF3]QNH71479.1 hypothetical protein AF3_031 [Rhizobium phage AF3]